MERRKKEEQESRKKREQEDKLIDAFETFLRPQRLTQWSEFVEKNETHESYVALKEMCGEKVVSVGAYHSYHSLTLRTHSDTDTRTHTGT
jgi:hypothetical protein